MLQFPFKPFNLMPRQATLLLPYIPQLATISQGSFTGMRNADMDNDQVPMATALMSSLLSPVPSCSYLNSWELLIQLTAPCSTSNLSTAAGQPIRGKCPLSSSTPKTSTKQARVVTLPAGLLSLSSLPTLQLDQSSTSPYESQGKIQRVC